MKRRTLLTRELSYAAGRDAGNRSMRKAGRKAWSREDYDAAWAEFNRLWSADNCPHGYKKHNCGLCNTMEKR